MLHLPFGKLGPKRVPRAKVPTTILLAKKKRDFYAILGVSKSAPPNELKKAYYNLAKTMHPDVSKDPKAKDKFHDITIAYQTLMDPRKRRLVDEGKEAEEDEEVDAEAFYETVMRSGVDVLFLEDEFEELNLNQGKNVDADVSLTFHEALLGCKKEIQVRTGRPCQTCAGTGSAKRKAPGFCYVCDGKGLYTVGSKKMKVPQICGTCHGTGSQAHPPLCKACGGKGIMSVTAKIEVDIPPGTYDGLSLRLPYQGDAGYRQAEAGHLFVQCTVAEDSYLKRCTENMGDIHVEVPLTVPQSMLGTTVFLELPGRRSTEFVVPPSTQGGTKFTLPGLGVPDLKRKDKKVGSIIATVVVWPYPKLMMTEEHTKLYKQLAEIEKPEAIHPIQFAKSTEYVSVGRFHKSNKK